MTLATLKSKLDAAKSGTDIVTVLFDFLQYANTKRTISHPFVIWDIGNIRGTKSIRSTAVPGLMTIDLYCMDLVTPEDDITQGALTKWDAIEADMLAYLTKVMATTNLTIENQDDIEYEYYPGGMLKMEREVGVRYRIQLKAWC